VVSTKEAHQIGSFSLVIGAKKNIFEKTQAPYSPTYGAIPNPPTPTPTLEKQHVFFSENKAHFPIFPNIIILPKIFQPINF